MQFRLTSEKQELNFNLPCVDLYRFQRTAIKPSEDWGDAIAEAIRLSNAFIIVFTSNYNRSRRVLDELNLAITKEAKILLFRIEKLDPSGAMFLHLASRH